MTPIKKPHALGQLLLERGVVSRDELDAALAEQQQRGGFIGTILTRRGVVTEEALVLALAEQFGMPYARLRDVEVQSQALAKVPATFASHYTLLPIRLEDNCLEVAIADPLNVQTLDELKLLLDCRITSILAGERDIREAIQRHYGVGAQAIERLLDTEGRMASAPPSAAEDISFGNAKGVGKDRYGEPHGEKRWKARQSLQDILKHVTRKVIGQQTRLYPMLARLLNPPSSSTMKPDTLLSTVLVEGSTSSSGMVHDIRASAARGPTLRGELTWLVGVRRQPKNLPRSRGLCNVGKQHSEGQPWRSSRQTVWCR